MLNFQIKMEIYQKNISKTENLESEFKFYVQKTALQSHLVLNFWF